MPSIGRPAKIFSDIRDDLYIRDAVSEYPTLIHGEYDRSHVGGRIVTLVIAGHCYDPDVQCTPSHRTYLRSSYPLTYVQCFATITPMMHTHPCYHLHRTLCNEIKAVTKVFLKCYRLLTFPQTDLN
jgi:hypothetical protein